MRAITTILLSPIILFACTRGSAFVPSEHHLMDGGLATAEPDVVRAFYSTRSSDRSAKFARLHPDDAVQVALHGLRREPPDAQWVAQAIALHGSRAVDIVLQVLDEANDNSQIESALDMMDRAVRLLPSYRLSDRDLTRCQRAAQRLKGELAQQIAQDILARLERHR